MTMVAFVKSKKYYCNTKIVFVSYRFTVYDLIDIEIIGNLIKNKKI